MQVILKTNLKLTSFNTCNDDLKNPLHLAALFGNLEIIETLLENKNIDDSPHLQNKDGDTPFTTGPSKKKKQK